MSKNTKEHTEEIIDSVFSEAPDDTMMKLLNEMYNSKDLEMKTDLSESKINLIVVARLMENVYRKEFKLQVPIKTMIRDYMALMVSKKRQGRAEYFKAVSNSSNEGRSLTDKILGRE